PLVAFELGQLGEGPGVPDPDRVVVRPADDAGAVGRHRNGSYGILMALELGHFREGPGVPDPDRVVVRPAHNPGAVGRHRNGVDGSFMALEDSTFSYRAERIVEIGGSERPAWSALDAGVIACRVGKGFESKKSADHR